MPISRHHNTLPFTINLLHGEVFKNTNPCTAMYVYVKAHIKGQETLRRDNEKKTNVDKHNGAHPIWNSQMKFNLDQRKLLEQGSNSNHKPSLELVLKVKASSPVFLGNEKIGEVRLPVKDLYNGVAVEEMVAWTSLRCPVLGGSGRVKGAVYLSYRFGIHDDEVKGGGAAVVFAASAPPLPPIGLYGDYE